MSISTPKFRIERSPGANGLPGSPRIVMDEPLLIRMAAHVRRRLLAFTPMRRRARRAAHLVLLTRSEVLCDTTLDRETNR